MTIARERILNNPELNDPKNSSSLVIEVKLLMGRDERELFFVHSVLLNHFRVVQSDRFVFIHTFKH